MQYSYEVINGGGIPISAIAIGESLYGSQLLTLPIGASADSIPRDCYSSPTGWEFGIITTEEQATISLSWERTDPTYEIFGGQRLGGFAVKLPQADPLYETCSWTASLTDGQEYEGVLQKSHLDSVPAAALVPTTPEEAVTTGESAPVYIAVTKTELGNDEVKYSYEVTNGSAIPVTAISIGFAVNAGGSLLTTMPTGAIGDTLPPPSCYTSPAGWRFLVVTTEEDSMMYIEWERTDPSREILGGHNLAGFSVNVPRADSLYETGWWTAWLGDGSTFEGVLQRSDPEVHKVYRLR